MKITLILVAVLIGYLTLSAVIESVQNYSGYCVAGKRYISDENLVRSNVRRLIFQRRVQEHSRRVDLEAQLKGVPRRTITYQSHMTDQMADDYMANHPDCCHIFNADNWNEELNGKFSEFDKRPAPRGWRERISGSSNKIVWIKDFVSKPEEAMDFKGFVTNCGQSDYGE